MKLLERLKGMRRTREDAEGAKPAFKKEVKTSRSDTMRLNELLGEHLRALPGMGLSHPALIVEKIADLLKRHGYSEEEVERFAETIKPLFAEFCQEARQGTDNGLLTFVNELLYGIMQNSGKDPGKLKELWTAAAMIITDYRDAFGTEDLNMYSGYLRSCIGTEDHMGIRTPEELKMLRKMLNEFIRQRGDPKTHLERIRTLMQGAHNKLLAKVPDKYDPARSISMEKLAEWHRAMLGTYVEFDSFVQSMLYRATSPNDLWEIVYSKLQQAK